MIEPPRCQMIKGNGRKCGMPARFNREGKFVCRSHWHKYVVKGMKP